MKITAPTISSDLDTIDDLKKQLLNNELLESITTKDQDLSDIKVGTARLSECKLQNVDLLQAHFEKLSVTDAILNNCSLIAAQVAGSEWNYARLTACQCSGVQFQTGKLANVTLDRKSVV